MAHLNIPPWLSIKASHKMLTAIIPGIVFHHHGGIFCCLPSISDDRGPSWELPMTAILLNRGQMTFTGILLIWEVSLIEARRLDPLKERGR
jgi:hypothetical protein